MSEYGVHKAKTHLSKLLMKATSGEEVVITRSGRPVARLVPITNGALRRLGVDRGRFEVPDDFDAPLPDEILDSFDR
jgi:prevent-host-death family protein